MRKYFSDNDYDYPPFSESLDYRPFRRKIPVKPAPPVAKLARKDMEFAFDTWLENLITGEEEEKPHTLKVD